MIFVNPIFVKEKYSSSVLPAYQSYKVLTGIDADFDRFFIKLNEVLS